MSGGIKERLKKVMIAALCITSVTSAVISSIPTAKAATSILGTNASLGSPILNQNSTSENWNKWEMVCWGVFLSNWCQPLIDNYESAFTVSSGKGSNGDGFKALAFGSGSDQENNKTIEDFCKYAINVQKSTDLKKIYVGYTKIQDGKLKETPDPNSRTNVVREAKFKDFYFQSKLSFLSGAEAEEGKTSVKVSNKSQDGYSVKTSYIESGYIPTFYIKNKSNKYIKILDYTDSWDVQAMSAMINAVHKSKSGKQYVKKFTKAFTEDYDSNIEIGFDTFGNIVTANDKLMVFPASNNQNITTDKSINLLNSWIVNNYISTYSSDKLISELHQTYDDSFLGFMEGFNGSTDNEYAGLPAFGGNTVKNSGYLYYDTDAIVEKDGSYSVSSTLPQLFDSDITSDKNKLPIEFEISGVGYNPGWFGIDASGNSMKTTTFVASMLPNIINKSKKTSNPEMLHKLINTDGSEISLFSEKPIVVPPQVVAKSEDSGISKNGDALRHFYNWLYQAYNGSVATDSAGSTNVLDAKQMRSYLSDIDTVEELKDLTDSKLWDYFIQAYPQFKDDSITGSAMWDVWDAGNNETLNSDCSRLCLVYPVSPIMKTVASVLGVQDGTEFNTYSTMLYMTYLDWYGVINKTTISTGKEAQSKFSKEVYDETSDILNVDPADLTDMKSKEDMEDEVLQMSYLMLSTEDGRSYRKELIFNGLSDFLYEQYNRIVYGGKSSTYSGSSTKSNSGFLSVATFNDNFLTSWFLKAYVDVAVIMMMVCIIIMIVVGLLKGRRLTWFIVGTFIIINVILLVPASGEITPAVTTNFAQKVFSSKMTYWALSEGVANASLEDDAYNTSGDMNKLSKEDASSVLKLVNKLSVVYTDRSLMMKQDVSQKLTQNLGGIYTDIQTIKSARWILPMVMQQFSQSSNTSTTGSNSDYVYVKLSNMWDDGSNLYWYYKPIDATTTTKATLTSQQFVSGKASVADSGGTDCVAVSTGNGDRSMYDGISQYYSDYTEPSKWADDTNTKINYANYSYTINNENKDNVHLYSYILHDQQLGFGNKTLSRKNTFGDKFSNYSNADSWQKWIDKAVSVLKKNKWATNKTGYYSYEKMSDKYDRTDASTLRDGYSYYRTTESPYYYFFNVAKDSLPSDKTIGALIGRLQGEIENDVAGNEVRSNFMYATETSSKEEENGGGTGINNSDVRYTKYVRDVADLQEFFTNTIPYMYEMTLASGGFDGESGVLKQDTITDESDSYKGNMQSWAYRCNWAVKLMENPSYSKNTSIGLKNGKRVTVANPMLPDAYKAAGRNMVFSEAQKMAYGLEDSDLSLVELKCIDVNKQIAKDWTTLINYAGTDGITKEIFFRLMGTSATEIFCREFSSSGILDNSYSLYPQSVDLRYLSFDAIMKMLMINVSHNTSYAYGDTMSTLLTDSDLVTAFILFITAVLCVWVIPLLQQIIMAAIFYLGFIAIFRSLFSSAAYKGKIAGAQVVSNLLFMIYTLMYYFFIGMLMSLSSNDEVLSIKKITTNPGNPFWMLLIVILLSCLYIFVMYQHLRFCFAHYRDMGAEMIGFVTGTLVGNMKNAVSGFSDSVTNAFSSSSDKTASASASAGNNASTEALAESIKGEGSSKDVKIDASGGNVNINTDSGNVKSDKSSNHDDNASNSDTYYINVSESGKSGTTTANDINAEIEAGEKIKK